MNIRVFAKRYAEGFIGYCRQTIGEQRGVDDLVRIKGIIAANPEFGDFLKSSRIIAQEKRELVDKVFGHVVAEQTRQFLKLLIDKGHIRFLSEIAECALKLHRMGHVSEGVLRTSVPLSRDTISLIKATLEKKFGKKMELSIQIDPALLGGIQVEMDNMVIDGSVRRRLEELKEKLMSIKVA